MATLTVNHHHDLSEPVAPTSLRRKIFTIFGTPEKLESNREIERKNEKVA